MKSANSSLGIAELYERKRRPKLSDYQERSFRMYDIIKKGLSEYGKNYGKGNRIPVQVQKDKRLKAVAVSLEEMLTQDSHGITFPLARVIGKVSTALRKNGAGSNVNETRVKQDISGILSSQYFWEHGGSQTVHYTFYARYVTINGEVTGVVYQRAA
ncbi:MAG TPA: hypothetical protein VJJ52_07545 [Candidatus Nanoarchaeia archaeon]|nr:hypothetical protein [Candidatus Nanoarchaeia archaeon]